uniref:Leukotriene A-4 hydrolase like n=1 Tax=Talaromyces marneffei PM1 TaxID=1077442 RepID=A0A093XMF1_TALMA
MFRRPRSTEPDPVALHVGHVLKPMPVMLWGGQAMYFLGAPIVLGDEDYQLAIKKLLDSGFQLSKPRRESAPEVLESLPDPQTVIDEINAGYRRVDEDSTTFDFPESSQTEEQLTLLPNSFVHLPPVNDLRYLKEYVPYDNLWYPCERALASSFVQATMDDEDINKYSLWVDVLRFWIGFMPNYLEVNNDIFDYWEFLDSRAKEWYSTHYGRAREAKYGPWDRRISKRIGSSKEMPIGARGNPLER